ncbi:MAG: hypothetical protein AB7Q81_00925 [Gammaproteobacteria bacterium]
MDGDGFVAWILSSTNAAGRCGPRIRTRAGCRGVHRSSCAVAERLERVGIVDDSDAVFGLWPSAPVAGGGRVENLRDAWEK